VTVNACDCNTAYGYNMTQSYDRTIAECFYDGGFSNWGWTNMMSGRGITLTVPMYAGLPVCDPHTLTDQSLADHKVGNAVVTYGSNGKVSVVYNIYPPFTLSSTHVNVAKDPDKYKKVGNKYTVSPGQYTSNGTYDGKIWVIVHAVVCGPSLPALQYKTKSAEIAPVASSLKAYPNPFSDKVVFEFATSKDTKATLEISNMLGQKIATLLNAPVKAGVMNHVEFSPENVAPGILIYQLITDDGNVQSGKLIYKK